MPLMKPLALLLALGLMTSHAAIAADPDPILLWPNGAPEAMGEEEQDQPKIVVHVPNDMPQTSAAVVICPGGGYGILATDHEGHQVARWFNRIGVTAIVLRYRHSPYRHPVPLMDVQRAIRYVRSHADEIGISPNRIGVMGFSAGGHLASTASTHFDAGDANADDPIDRVSCRPDFTILGYPVISLTAPFAHGGSRRNLLGDTDTDELAMSLSNETQVTSETPPAFLFHTGEDTGVPPQNSVSYYLALHEHGVPAELHIYQNGPHGAGLGDGDPVLATWRDRLADWLKTNGFLVEVERVAASGRVTFQGQPLRWGTITFHPEDDENLPVAWAMISNGNFSVPAHRGLPLGRSRVVIRNWGSVEPRATIDDVELLTGDVVQSPLSVMTYSDVESVFDFELE